MTVRQKITLLITAAGFISSLVFSCIILWEMLEQPFRIIDSDLESISRRAVHIVSGNDMTKTSDAISSIGDEHYWLEIHDLASGKSIYRSDMAKLIEIPEQNPGPGITVHLTIARETIDLRQDSRNVVAFRVKTSKISSRGRTFLVRAGRPIEKLEEEVGDIFVGVISGLIFSVLLLAAISYFLTGFILKPVRIINNQARDISEKQLDRRIPVSGEHDEFNALAQTLNQVFDRLQNAFLRQKRLLADASHELKTPLTMMRLVVDEMRSNHNDNPSRLQAEKLEKITEQVLRMERLVKSLLDLSSLEIEGVALEDQVDVVKILESLIADYHFLAEPRGIDIEVCLPQQLIVKGNAEKLNHAFSNIFDNAVKYNVDGGRVEVAIEQSTADYTITVTNTGPGVDEAEISKVFDQFYRVEGSRSPRYGGSGLGLAIVKKIVELHSGKVKFDSQQGSWTRVTVSLPRGK